MVKTDDLRKRARLETVVRLTDNEALELADELDELRQIADEYWKREMQKLR